MTIGYVSRDAVDRFVAGRLPRPEGVRAVAEASQDDLPVETEAVVFGLDSLPPDERRRLLLELVRRPRWPLAGVHSYHLDDDEARALQQAGVLVFERLDASVFSRVAAAGARRAA